MPGGADGPTGRPQPFVHRPSTGDWVAVAHDGAHCMDFDPVAARLTGGGPYQRTALLPPLSPLPPLVRLTQAGVPRTGVLRLVRLRVACRRQNMALDGYEPDPRARFARWLYERGRLRD